MKQITQSIQNGVSLAYISLLIDATNLFTSPGRYNIEEIDKDMGAILREMKDHILSLETLIGSKESSRGELALTLQSYHKTLENKFKVITGYSRELNHISSLLENKYHLETALLQDIEGINYQQFIHEGLDFISQARPDQDRVDKLREFLRYLPMRMTKNSFISYVEESLQKVALNPLDPEGTLFLSVFKQIFDGRLTQDYGLAFPDIAMAIEELRTESQTKLTSNSIEVIFDDIFLLKDTIEELYTIIITLHRSISSFSTLLLLDSLDFDILCGEHVAFKDLFYTAKSLLGGDIHGEDYMIISETLPERLTHVWDEVNENYHKSASDFYKSLDKDSFPKTQESLKLIKVFSLIQFYLRLNVEDAFSFREPKDTSSQIPGPLISSATIFLKDQLDTLKPGERKLRMQYLISMLPFTMSTGEFANYFTSALEGTSSEIQKAYVLAKLSNFMDSFGYFDGLQANACHHDHDHCDHY